MKPKRDRLRVIYDLLHVIQSRGNSIKPTPLMRYSNLSTQRFTEYFTELNEKGLIREIEDKKGRKRITLTDQGFAYLEKYKLIENFIETFDL